MIVHTQQKAAGRLPGTPISDLMGEVVHVEVEYLQGYHQRILKGHLSPKPTPLQMQSVQQTSPAAAQMIFKANLIPEWSGEYLHFSELWYRSQQWVITKYH